MRRNYLPNTTVCYIHNALKESREVFSSIKTTNSKANSTKEKIAEAYKQIASIEDHAKKNKLRNVVTPPIAKTILSHANVLYNMQTTYVDAVDEEISAENLLKLRSKILRQISAFHKDLLSFRKKKIPVDTSLPKPKSSINSRKAVSNVTVDQIKNDSSSLFNQLRQQHINTLPVQGSKSWGKPWTIVKLPIVPVFKAKNVHAEDWRNVGVKAFDVVSPYYYLRDQTILIINVDNDKDEYPKPDVFAQKIVKVLRSHRRRRDYRIMGESMYNRNMVRGIFYWLLESSKLVKLRSKITGSMELRGWDIAF